MTKEEYEKMEEESAQKALDFYNTLSPEEKNRVDAINQAHKTLKEAGVPHWLIVERELRLSESQNLNQYTTYNWCPTIFGEDGQISDAGFEFLENHQEGLLSNSYVYLHKLASSYEGTSTPTWSQISSLFYQILERYWKKQLEII